MKKKIEQYFAKHQDEMLSDIMDLIRINSERKEPIEGMPFGEGAAKVLALALSKAEAMGFKVKNYDNYVGTVDLSDQETQLDILAHLDVVPAIEEWTVTKPFEPIIKDGMLYGRGSSDNKGPAIAALYAMKAIKDLGIPLSKNVRLIWGTDEECGGSDIDYYYDKEKTAPMTFSPDAEFPVINLEKGGLRGVMRAECQPNEVLPKILSIQSGSKINIVPGAATAQIKGMSETQISTYCKRAEEATGVLFTWEQSEEGVYTISAKGESAHASLPQLGNNALTGILKLLVSMPFAESEGYRKLTDFYHCFPHGDWLGTHIGVEMSDEVSNELTLSVNMMTLTEEGFTAQFDCRAPLCANNINMRDVVKERLCQLGIVLENRDMYLPHYVPEDTPFVQTLLKCYEMYSGKEGKCIAIGGGTYVHGIENGVAFGCNREDINTNAHGIDEFMPVEDLIMGAQIFTQAIIELCK